MSLKLPELHKKFIDNLVEVIIPDERFIALLIGGSAINDEMDNYSDIDLTIIVRSKFYQQVIDNRREFAKSIGGLISCFTGEHIGEPRLLICLYGPELLHVDIKFIIRDDLYSIIEKPIIIWARDEAKIKKTINKSNIGWPNKAPEWFEDRIWIWLHYAATKLKRGELMESLGSIAFCREQVLGPMVHRHLGNNQRGVRKIEFTDTELTEKLALTHAKYDAISIKDAIKASINLYMELRKDGMPFNAADSMPEIMLNYLDKGGN